MAKNTIKLKNYSDFMEEYTATAAAITPGHLVEIDNAGLVKKHSTAGGNALPPMFAVEDELQGGAIATAYAASSKIQVWTPYRGDIVYALLKNAENAAIGEALESAGDGTLQCHVADSGVDLNNSIVGIAMEAVIASGATRIKVKIV